MWSKCWLLAVQHSSRVYRELVAGIGDVHARAQPVHRESPDEFGGFLCRRFQQESRRRAG